MLIGEAPGAREDELGRPVCGRAGNFVDELFAEICWDRRNTYITSIVKCRPPKNRRPHDVEIETCGKLWLKDQIELVNPYIVVLLGRVSVNWVFREKTNLRSLHGQLRDIKGRIFVPTYHPAAAMRFPEAKKNIRDDFRLVKNMLHPF